MGTLIDRFEEHDGPVRGVDFVSTGNPGIELADLTLCSIKRSQCLFREETITKSRYGAYRPGGV